MRGTRHENWVESAAMGASLLCLVHCLVLPLLIAALPALSHVLTFSESFHLWVLAFAVPASGAALWDGRMRHGANWPLAVGIAGLVALTIGAVWFGGTPGELPMTVAGSLLLGVAHVANWKLRRTCRRV